MVIVLRIVTALSPYVRANPIPWPPPAAVPAEEMKVAIWQADER